MQPHLSPGRRSQFPRAPIFFPFFPTDHLFPEQDAHPHIMGGTSPRTLKWVPFHPDKFGLEGSRGKCKNSLPPRMPLSSLTPRVCFCFKNFSGESLLVPFCRCIPNGKEQVTPSPRFWAAKEWGVSLPSFLTNAQLSKFGPIPFFRQGSCMPAVGFEPGSHTPWCSTALSLISMAHSGPSSHLVRFACPVRGSYFFRFARSHLAFHLTPTTLIWFPNVLPPLSSEFSLVFDNSHAACLEKIALVFACYTAFHFLFFRC